MNILESKVEVSQLYHCYLTRQYYVSCHHNTFWLNLDIESSYAPVDYLINEMNYFEVMPLSMTSCDKSEHVSASI